MANLDLSLPVAMRGGGAPDVNALTFPVNTWRHYELTIDGTEWLTLSGLSLGYAGHVSLDGGVTWIDWGGVSAISDQARDRAGNRTGNLGRWNWSDGTLIGIPSFWPGGRIRLTVTCPTAFRWGATVHMLDT